MFRVIINSNLHGQVYRDFETIELANEYVSEVTVSQHWGRNEWIENVEDVPAVYDGFGQLVTPAVTHPEVRPAEWSYQILDITVLAAKKRLLDLGQKRQLLGSQIIAQVFSLNESKGLSAESFQAMLQNTTLQNIERLLKNGSLRTAKVLIQSLDGTFFTDSEKSEIIATIDSSGLV